MRSGIKICVAWGKSIPETKTSAKASKLHLMRQEIARRLVWPQQSQHRDETHGELRARSRTGQGEGFKAENAESYRKAVDFPSITK